MLHEFLTTHREALILRCRTKVAKRPVPPPTSAELTYGIPLFLAQITETLRLEATADLDGSRRLSGPTDPARTPTTTAIGEAAASHGAELQLKGFSVDQVVHDYGDLCQAVTEFAAEQNAPISVAEFGTLNRCLDNAIADAVTRFGDQREQAIREHATQDTNERLGYLAHELGNKLNVARLAYEAIRRGNVGFAGATGTILLRSLMAMRTIIDHSFADVRLGADQPPPQHQRILIASLFEELQIFAGMEAGAKGVRLAVRQGDDGLAVNGDRHTLASAIANLLQNAVKYTPTGGAISLGAQRSNNRILIEIADECGGLPPGDVNDLFKAFTRRSRMSTGLGLGLSISKRGVEANNGTLTVANRPGLGCVFRVDLPMMS
jgi:signal transduction histidine kinase